MLRDQEVERVGVLDATIVADQRDPDGSGWVVMTDPEGKEFVRILLPPTVVQPLDLNLISWVQ